jgi:hypothetical protein
VSGVHNANERTIACYACRGHGSWKCQAEHYHAYIGRIYLLRQAMFLTCRQMPAESSAQVSCCPSSDGKLWLSVYGPSLQT